MWMVREPMPPAYPGTRIVGTGSAARLARSSRGTPPPAPRRPRRRAADGQSPAAGRRRPPLAHLARPRAGVQGRPAAPAPRPAYLTNPTRPFLYQGKPAVIDFLPEGPVPAHPGGRRLDRRGPRGPQPPEGRDQTAGRRRDPASACGMPQPAAPFRISGGRRGFGPLDDLHPRRAGPAQEQVRPLAEGGRAGGTWTASVFRRPSPGSSYYLDPGHTTPPSGGDRGRHRGSAAGAGGWNEFFSHRPPATGGQLSAGPSRETARTHLSRWVSARRPRPTSSRSSLTADSWARRSSRSWATRSRRSTPEPDDLVRTQYVPANDAIYGVPAAIPLLMAIILSVLVAIYRSATTSRRAAAASWRRCGGAAWPPSSTSLSPWHRRQPRTTRSWRR